MVGTLEYMAPEVLLKEAGGFPSDIYAFAVTVSELVTGTFPFSDCTSDNPKAHTVLEMGYGRSAQCTRRRRAFGPPLHESPIGTGVQASR